MVDSKSKEDAAPDEVDDQERLEESGQQLYSLEYESPCCVLVTVEPDGEELQKEYEEQFRTYQDNAQLPGFRPGRAPRALVERKFGESIKEQVLQMAASEIYSDAIRKEDVLVVNELETPDFENIDWEPDKPVKLNYRCEVIPSIDLDELQYKGIEIKSPAGEIPEELFESALAQFVSRFSEWEELDGDSAIDQKDSVEAAVRVILPELKDGPDAGKFHFRPESGRIGPFEVEGLKGAVVGAKKGDTVEVEARLSVEAGEGDTPAMPELKNAEKIVIELDIEGAYRMQVPEVDDELAGKLGLESADEIRQMVRSRVERDVGRERREFMRTELLNRLGEKIELELPDSLVEHSAQDARRREALRRWREEGEDLEKAREAVAEDKSFDSRTEQSLKAEYVLGKIGEKERIFVSESELDEQINIFAARNGIEPQRARRALEKQDMLDTWRRDMRREKIIDMLLENAEVNEVEWSEIRKTGE